MNREIRVLYVMRREFPDPRPDVAVLFGKYLPRFGVSTSILAYHRGSDLAWEGGSLHVVDARSTLRWFTMLRQCIQLAGRHHAVQVRDKIFFAAAAAVCARLRRKPFFYWMSWPFAEDDIEKYHYMKNAASYAKRMWFLARGHVQRLVLYRLVLRLADHVFVQSDAMKSWLHQTQSVPLEKMSSVPMGVDLNEVEQDGHPEGDGQLGPPVVAYLGVIGRLRMENVLFDALQQTMRAVPGASVEFIGGGQEAGDEEWLAAELAKRGMRGRFTITGWIPRAEAWSRLSRAAVAISILPPHLILDISSPTKVIEYAALGVPCVATGTPDQQAVISRLGCGVCVPYDSDQIAAALVSLLEDTDLRRKLSPSPDRVKGYRSYDVISAALADVYHALLTCDT